MTGKIQPADVVTAGECVADALQAGIDLDWSVRAGNLDWTVDQTISHLTAAPVKYSLYLASRSPDFIAVTIASWPDATKTERIDAIRSVAHALANIAAATPPDVRACHSSGMLDAEGFVALGCLELLVHGHDICAGLGLPLEPSSDLAERLVARLVPWLVEDDAPSWRKILWHTGRIDIPGRAHSDEMWRAVAIPLSEWDGSIPRRDPRPVVGWVRGAGGWEPRYAE